MQTIVRRARHVTPLLLRLYPDYWRVRYGDEFAALLEACPLRLSTLLDVLLGALDAHINPQDATGRIVRMINRPRRSAIVVFWAYIAFVLAGLNFSKSTEDDIRRLTSVHSDLALVYFVIEAGAALALLAVLAGGVPLALAALWRAWEQKRWDIPLLLAVPPVALAVWIGWTLVIVLLITPSNPHVTASDPRAGLVLLSWGGLFLLAALASTAAVSIAMSRSGLSPRLFRLALWPAAAATVFMAIVLAAVVLWGLAVRTDVPSYLNTPDTPFRLAYSIVWIADVVVMAVATLVAAVALVRGFNRPRRAQAPHASVDAA
jgi:hypothetical protein